MSDLQNQFYTSISKHYSEIFPFNPGQLNFIKDKLGDLNDKNLLDIGCATGELARALSAGGATVTGIDLNDDLLKQAKAKHRKENLSFQHGNMLELKTDFEKAQFDAVVCFGNTLVHLQSTSAISEMLRAVRTVLKPKGQFLLQILNYDYILEDRVETLPLIETENLRFVRKYKFEEGSKHVQFQTELEIIADHTRVSNITPLLALKSSELIELLEDEGFQNIKLYSNFKQEKFGGTHIPLVLSCYL